MLKRIKKLFERRDMSNESQYVRHGLVPRLGTATTGQSSSTNPPGQNTQELNNNDLAQAGCSYTRGLPRTTAIPSTTPEESLPRYNSPETSDDYCYMRGQYNNETRRRLQSSRTHQNTSASGNHKINFNLQLEVEQFEHKDKLRLLIDFDKE